MNKWKNIQLIVSDFDGVMTDNRVLVDENGKESVYVSRADGQGIKLLNDINIKVIILSTETNRVVEKRAKKLGVGYIQGVHDKAKCLSDYCNENGISINQVCYIGNDINDYEAMCISGIKIVPNDAYKKVKEIADYITKARGGYGVIREVADCFQYYKGGKE